MKSKTKNVKGGSVSVQGEVVKAGVYFIKRKDGLFESVPEFDDALAVLRKEPEKVVVNGLTGNPIARMGVLLLAPRTIRQLRKLPYQEIMEREIDIIGESVKESVGLRSYDKIRSDACGDPFTLSFSVVVNTSDHEVNCTMSGSIKVKNKATLSLPNPQQPELDLRLKEDEKMERVAQQIERDSHD